jgi:hypothetical protein
VCFGWVNTGNKWVILAKKGYLLQNVREKNTCFEFGLPIWVVVGF